MTNYVLHPLAHLIGTQVLARVKSLIAKSCSSPSSDTRYDTNAMVANVQNYKSLLTIWCSCLTKNEITAAVSMATVHSKKAAL